MFDDDITHCDRGSVVIPDVVLWSGKKWRNIGRFTCMRVTVWARFNLACCACRPDNICCSLALDVRPSLFSKDDTPDIIKRKL